MENATMTQAAAARTRGCALGIRRMASTKSAAWTRIFQCRICVRRIVVAALLLISAGAAFADFEAALRAYRAGDHEAFIRDLNGVAAANGREGLEAWASEVAAKTGGGAPHGLFGAQRPHAEAAIHHLHELLRRHSAGAAGFKALSGLYSKYENKDGYLVALRETAAAGSADAAWEYVLLMRTSDPDAAMQWVRRAAESGHPNATVYLARAHLGDLTYPPGKYGLKQWNFGDRDRFQKRFATDQALAFRLYEEWARNPRLGPGQTLVHREVIVAWLYLEGIGTSPRYDVALARFQRGIETGYAYHLAASGLATMYSEGKGVKRDEKLAFEWWSKSVHAPKSTGN